MHDVGLCDSLRSGLGREGERGLRTEGTHICLRPVHTDVWQKPSQYYKVVLFQLNNNKLKMSLRKKTVPQSGSPTEAGTMATGKEVI